MRVDVTSEHLDGAARIRIRTTDGAVVLHLADVPNTIAALLALLREVRREERL